MLIIFEINAKSVKKKTFYDYCNRHQIRYFKDIQENHYYAKLDTTEKDNGELTYILLRQYLIEREISFVIYFASMENE